MAVIIEQSHPLDEPYHKESLDFIRAHLHDSIVRKICNLSRSDYIITFDEAREGQDIMHQAGRPMQICLMSSPFNGPRVEYLTRRAFSIGDVRLNQFKRFYKVVRKADAVRWYRLDISGEAPAEYQREEMKFWKKTIQTTVAVTIVNTETKRTIRLEQINGNAYDCEIAAMKIMLREKL